MKRFSVLSVDSPGSQENSNVSFPNKKLCAQNSTESPFPSRIQAFSTVAATTQQQQNSSLQHPSSDGYLQQLLSSQLTRTLPVGENLTNFDFLRLGNSEDKTARQNGISNISDNFAQDQLALVNNIPMPLRNNMTTIYNNPLSIDFNTLQFSFNNNTNLQDQHWILESNQQNNFSSNRERQANLTMDSIKSNSIDKLYGQIKKEEADYCPQSFADEMELRISELISSQNKMLTDFKEKNHLVQDSLKVALDEIKGLNQVIKRQNPFATNKPLSDPLGTHQTIVNTNDVASSEVLITYLCGPNTDFEYNLILKSELQLPLYRERNFKFTVVLTDKQGNLVQNLEEFPLTLSIYNSENPPKSIETNNSGNKVLKGVNVKSMINGVASFEKIQIKEVTSHLRNGWIFIVVQPMILQNEKSNPRPLSSNRGKQPVDIKKIKPLVIDKIVVKAKKLKEKDPSEDNDDN